MSSSDRNSGWAPTQALGDAGRNAADEAWQATRAQTALATQILGDRVEREAAAREIGQQISASERELFVSCDPGQALQQQFDHLQPSFIAVHDISTSTSRRLLASIAAAANRPLQKLVIRRQGYGTPLATIEFAELATGTGAPLAIYTTDCEADTVSRHAIARTLLGYSRLAVVIVGDLPAHAIDGAFRALREDMNGRGWSNRDMLLLPLAPSSALAALGVELSRTTPVGVRTTPVVTRPADAWDFISGAWSRLGSTGTTEGGRAVAPERPQAPPVPAPAAPLQMRPMPPVPGAQARAQPARPQTILERYAQRVCDLSGVVGCCVFDVAQARLLAQAGSGPPPAELAQQGAELVAALGGAARSLGLGAAIPELAVTLAAHHLLIKPMPRHPGCALHVVLDKAQANLTLARLQLGRLDAMFDEAPVRQ